MIKTRCSIRVFIRNGNIRRSIPVGLERANEEQLATIDLIKPVLHVWLRSRLSREELPNAEVLIKAKYSETSNGLAIEFKVQSVKITEFGA